MARPPVLRILINARRFILLGMTKFDSVEAKALSERAEVLWFM
jgi:hypothetical protein